MKSNDPKFIQMEINVTTQLIDETLSLLQQENPNPSLKNLNVLKNVLFSHVYLLRELLPKHGTTNEYTRGCRCEKCKKAKAQYNKAYSALKKGKK